MTQLLGIVGSLRSGSVNRMVARAAVDGVASVQGISLTLHSVADVPLYNGDLEEAGIPQSVQNLHDAVGAADGVIFFSPEYNGSFPAVVKNVIDWLSRPPKAWEGSALTMVVTTPGPRAGAGLRTHFSAIMEQQPIRLHEPLGIGSYSDKIADGALSDTATIEELMQFVAAFAAFGQN